MHYNLNAIASVELTDVGLQVYRLHYQGLGLDSSPYEEKYIKNSMLTTELWHIMEIFGPHIYQGCEVPFKNNQIIVEQYVGLESIC